MNQQILEDFLWNDRTCSGVVHITSSPDEQFKVTLRIARDGTEYLDSFICSSKNEAIRYFDLIKVCAIYICN